MIFKRYNELRNNVLFDNQIILNYYSKRNKTIDKTDKFIKELNNMPLYWCGYPIYIEKINISNLDVEYTIILYNKIITTVYNLFYGYRKLNINYIIDIITTDEQYLDFIKLSLKQFNILIEKGIISSDDSSFKNKLLIFYLNKEIDINWLSKNIKYVKNYITDLNVNNKFLDQHILEFNQLNIASFCKNKILEEWFIRKHIKIFNKFAIENILNFQKHISLDLRKELSILKKLI